MFRRAPALVQVCSGASSSTSTSLASSSPFPTALAVLSFIMGPLVQQAGHLVECWRVGGALEGALH